MAEYDSICPLCKLEKVTAWHHEDPDFVILDCDVCWVPMGVMKKHGNSEQESPGYSRMLNKLAEVADKVLGKGNWWIDPIQRSVPGHTHAHARHKGWW